MTLSAIQLDALAEIVNIGSGRAAAQLSELVGDRIDLSTSLTVCSLDELTRLLASSAEPAETAVIQDFSGDSCGRALLAFPKVSGAALAKLIAGINCPEDDLEEDLCGVLEEVGNIVLNSVLGTLGNEAHVQLTYSVPKLSVGRLIDATLLVTNPSCRTDCLQLVLADTRFQVISCGISGSLILVFEFASLSTMLDSMLATSR